MAVTAEIVSVGTELLLGQIADTDAQHLGRALAEAGITHHHRQTVGDNLDRLAACLTQALERADLVITIGGLGPTEDDLTREGVAKALGQDLVVDEEALRQIRGFFTARNLPWVESQIRQAQKPHGATLIPNPNGTAPGLLWESGGKTVLSLPGPRGEFVPMVDGPVREVLRRLGGGEVFRSRVLRICGLGESVVEEKVRALIGGTSPSVAPYAHPGEVHLRITARAMDSEAADLIIAPVESKIRELLGDAVFGADDETLESVVLELLVAQGATLSVAESVTGGGIAERLTGVPGASRCFVGGMIAYTPSMKASVLGVPDEVAADPVSAPCAQSMAERVRDLAATTYGLSSSGNAGPSADAGGKDVGLVYVSVCGPSGGRVEEHRFRGQRDFVRRRAEQAALTLLRRVLLEDRAAGS